MADKPLKIKMNPKCTKCHVDLAHICAVYPWSDEEWQCPECDGTWCIFQFCEKCGKELSAPWQCDCKKQ